MDILYLSIVFLVIVVIIWLKKPLFVAMTGGIAATIILFRVNLKDAVMVLGRQTVAWDTIDVLLSFYLIIFLQLMLEKKEGSWQMQRILSRRLLRNRRMNTIVSPAIMGLLPSAAVMTICADMVDKTCGEYMDAKNKTFVSMLLQTYTGDVPFQPFRLCFWDLHSADRMLACLYWPWFLWQLQHAPWYM